MNRYKCCKTRNNRLGMFSSYLPCIRNYDMVKRSISDAMTRQTNFYYHWEEPVFNESYKSRLSHLVVGVWLRATWVNTKTMQVSRMESRWTYRIVHSVVYKIALCLAFRSYLQTKHNFKRSFQTFSGIEITFFSFHLSFYFLLTLFLFISSVNWSYSLPPEWDTARITVTRILQSEHSPRCSRYALLVSSLLNRNTVSDCRMRIRDTINERYSCNA